LTIVTVHPVLEAHQRQLWASPNETVEKVHFSYFLGKMPFENQELMSDDFRVLGFFDSLNTGAQAIAKSPSDVRSVGFGSG
jgi:hypothetical protein